MEKISSFLFDVFALIKLYLFVKDAPNMPPKQKHLNNCVFIENCKQQLN